MLSYISVLSAYLKTQLAYPTRAGRYDLISKNTETQETGQDFLFFNDCLYLCPPYVVTLVVYHWFGLCGCSLNQNRRVSVFRRDVSCRHVSRRSKG